MLSVIGGCKTMTYEEMASVLADRLRAARKACRQTLEDVAKIVGINRNTLSSYECGRFIPNALNVALLAEHYAVSIEWLLGIE